MLSDELGRKCGGFCSNAYKGFVTDRKSSGVGEQFSSKMIIRFARIAREEVRSMFINLFDEGKDVYEWIDAFKQKSNSLLERYGNGAAQHYQYENEICTYLWLRYPDKYYIYKLMEIKTMSNELESDYMFKKGAYADNIRNFLAFYNEICAELQQDEELKDMFA